MKRVFASDASLKERAVALGVAAAMKVKRTLTGKGLARRKPRRRKLSSKKKTSPFSFLIKNAKLAIKKSKPDNVHSAINTAMTSVKQCKKGKRILKPRTIKLPSIKGGILPLIPIFAGLSAFGSLAGTGASIVNAIQQTRKAQRALEENKRHNRTIEAIAVGNKIGHGLYLHRDKHGKGFFLTHRSKNR